MLHDQVQEAAELVGLAAKVGVQQRVVALAATPQHVVRSTQPMGHLEAVAHLGRRTGEHLGIGVRRRAGRVPRVGEQVGRAPQQPHAGPVHVVGGLLCHHVEQFGRLAEPVHLGGDVGVVEAEERHSELLEELERDGHLLAGGARGVGSGVEPRAVERRGAEDVLSRPTEAVPVADREAEVLAHRLAGDHAIGVVEPEGERVVAVRALEGDGPVDLGEERRHRRPTIQADGRVRPMGQRIEFASNGDVASGYLATPDGGGPGVLVVQEWWGLVPQIVRVCDRLAAAGFVALAPDLFRGEMAEHTEMDKAGELMSTLPMDRAARDMSGAIDALLSHDGVRGDGVGVVGFCMGGMLCLAIAAQEGSRVAAAAPYYGAPLGDGAPDWSNLTARVRGHFAEHDDFFPWSAVSDLGEELRGLGKDVEFTLHPGTGHAFANDENSIGTYDPSVADAAWQETLEFLHATLDAQ